MRTPPWKLPSDLPWHALKSPVEQWHELPSFLVGEFFFVGLAALCLWHALRQPDRGRHLLAFFGSLIVGTANDMFFMALPLVDIFWQAQATIMLTPRLPLYIPCVYICFMYIPLIAASRMRLPLIPKAALSGLGAGVFYWPYDVVGAKHLWWTWHDSDPAVQHRLFGAPVGSTQWTIVFTATFALLFHLNLRRAPDPVPARAVARTLLLCALFSTPLMMAQMPLWQTLDGGVPGPRGLVGMVLLYAAITALGLRRAVREPRSLTSVSADQRLATAVAAHFTVMALITAAFHPEDHRDTSLHQTYGPCHVVATDITGKSRYRYVCAADYDEDYRFCGAPAKDGSDWYSVCGTPYRSRARQLAGVAGVGLLGGLLLCGLLYGRLGARRRDAPTGAT